MTHPAEREITQEMVSALHQSSGSFELAFGTVIAALLGFLLDRWLGITPVLTIVLGVAGLIGATTSVVYSYRARMQAADAARAERRADEQDAP